MQEHEGVLCPIRFVGRTLKEGELRYHLAEKEVLALMRVLTVCHTLVVGRKLKVLTRHSTMKWIFTSKALVSRVLQWAV